MKIPRERIEKLKAQALAVRSDILLEAYTVAVNAFNLASDLLAELDAEEAANHEAKPEQVEREQDQERQPLEEGERTSLRQPD